MRTPIAMNNPAETDGKSCEIMVFKTSIRIMAEVRFLARILDEIPQIKEWSLDMEDWEKILRVTVTDMKAAEVTSFLQNAGIHSKLLANMKILSATPLEFEHSIKY